MSFTLRQVTQRAGGGEIVRTKKIDGAELLIGRGTECDLQLPDLAVSLQHARMVQTGPGKVSIEGLSGQSFEADGRFTSRANLDLSRSPVLMIGSHVLSLTQGGADEVLIGVARAEPAVAPQAIDQEVRTLAPGTVGISKRATAWVLGG